MYIFGFFLFVRLLSCRIRTELHTFRSSQVCFTFSDFVFHFVLSFRLAGMSHTLALHIVRKMKSATAIISMLERKWNMYSSIRPYYFTSSPFCGTSAHTVAPVPCVFVFVCVCCVLYFMHVISLIISFRSFGGCLQCIHFGTELLNQKTFYLFSFLLLFPFSFSFFPSNFSLCSHLSNRTRMDASATKNRIKWWKNGIRQTMRGFVYQTRESILSTHFIAVELMWNNRDGLASRFRSKSRFSGSRARSWIEFSERYLLERWQWALSTATIQSIFAIFLRECISIVYFNLIENTCTFADSPNNKRWGGADADVHTRSGRITEWKKQKKN